MRAVRYHAARDIRVEDVPETDGLAPHEVLIRPRFCGICGTDLHEYMAGPIVTPTEPHPLTGAQNPQILGHEFSADVLDVGPEVLAEAERGALQRALATGSRSCRSPSAASVTTAFAV